MTVLASPLESIESAVIWLLVGFSVVTWGLALVKGVQFVRLKNPAPEYPSLAQRRGWEGTVLLRVQVLASGKPGDIQIQKSSGRQQLDDAALAAVKRWSFVPAKQGDVAQDGWVSVPIDFKIR